MFGLLAKERRKHEINAGHSRLIRESALDLVEDADGNISVDEAEATIDTDAASVPDEVVNSIESKVDKLLEGKDLTDLSEDDIDSIANQLSNEITEDEVKAVDRNVD